MGAGIYQGFGGHYKEPVMLNSPTTLWPVTFVDSNTPPSIDLLQPLDSQLGGLGVQQTIGGQLGSGLSPISSLDPQAPLLLGNQGGIRLGAPIHLSGQHNTPPLSPGNFLQLRAMTNVKTENQLPVKSENDTIRHMNNIPPSASGNFMHVNDFPRPERFQCPPPNRFQHPPPNFNQRQPMPDNFRHPPPDNFRHPTASTFQSPPPNFQTQSPGNFRPQLDNFHRGPRNDFRHPPPDRFQRPPERPRHPAERPHLPTNNFRQVTGNFRHPVPDRFNLAAVDKFRPQGNAFRQPPPTLLSQAETFRPKHPDDVFRPSQPTNFRPAQPDGIPSGTIKCPSAI